MFFFAIKTIPKEIRDHSLDHLFGFIFPKNKFYLFCYLYFLGFLELKKKKPTKRTALPSDHCKVDSPQQPPQFSPIFHLRRGTNSLGQVLRSQGRTQAPPLTKLSPSLKEPERPKRLLLPRGCLQGTAAGYLQ